ncbi:MAG: hypothetical protein M0Z72_06480 [Deltaproteobacteria bacterium]|nr:hypothetical protein [Deltaproteobacteria bacterium]
MEQVEVKIITKCPPHGRCKMYSSIVWLIISTFRNVKISVVPEDFKDKTDPAAPCVIIKGKVVEPSNTVYVSGGDFVNALKKAGAVPYEGVSPDISAFDEAIEKCRS